MTKNGGQSPQDSGHVQEGTRRQIEGKGLHSKKKSERRDRKEDFGFLVALVQHELGNDLQIILGNIEAIDMGVNGESNETHRRLVSAQAAAKRMTNILAALGSGTDFHDGSILDMLVNATDVAKDVHSGLTINLDVADEVSAASLPCYGLLNIVFENILRNAAEHCGGKAVVDISVSLDTKNIIIEFADDGPGVPADIQARIFQKGASTNGGGLGLYLSQKLLGAYDGKIELVPSRKGNGARFQITLPIEI